MSSDKDLIGRNPTLPALDSDRPSDPVSGEWLPPTPGTIIGETHRVLGTLGEGGMGVVLLCYDEKLERQVAIKVIKPSIANDVLVRDRFLAEARAMAKVRHEAVVAIYSFGEFHDRPFFVMEYVPGLSVEQHLDAREQRPLDIDDAIGIMERVSLGVSAIHNVGAVHGDLKPGNVLIGPAFRICVTDFGLALDSNVARHLSLGTPAYLAPERVRGDAVAPHLMPRSDVYALGIMTYELLTGMVPYDAADSARIMMQHLHKPIPSILKARPDLPASFQGLFERALAKDPEERTASAKVFRDELLAARSEIAQEEVDTTRILVVDDDEDFQRLVMACLSDAFTSTEFVAVGGGHEALAAVHKTDFDLAVIDLNMPGMNGVELTASLRATKSGRELPILVVTGFGGASDWQVLSQLGADGFIVKPLEPESLIAASRRLVQRS